MPFPSSRRPCWRVSRRPADLVAPESGAELRMANLTLGRGPRPNHKLHVMPLRIELSCDDPHALRARVAHAREASVCRGADPTRQVALYASARQHDVSRQLAGDCLRHSFPLHRRLRAHVRDTSDHHVRLQAFNLVEDGREASGIRREANGIEHLQADLCRSSSPSNFWRSKFNRSTAGGRPGLSPAN